MKRLAAMLVILACASPALAQLRTIPQDAVRGEMRHAQDMYVYVDGARERLSPGAQIRDASNRVIVPAALPPYGARVKYIRDPQGLVYRVWILSAEEAARPDRR